MHLICLFNVETKSQFKKERKKDEIEFFRARLCNHLSAEGCGKAGYFSVEKFFYRLVRMLFHEERHPNWCNFLRFHGKVLILVGGIGKASFFHRKAEECRLSFSWNIFSYTSFGNSFPWIRGKKLCFYSFSLWKSVRTKWWKMFSLEWCPASPFCFCGKAVTQTCPKKKIQERWTS